MSAALVDDLALEARPCRREDPELWFSDDADDQRLAKALCRQCPLSSECLDQALENVEEFGIWGGLDPDERRALRRRRRKLR